MLNPSIPTSRMFAVGPEDLKPEWFKESRRFQDGIRRVGQLLSGGRE